MRERGKVERERESGRRVKGTDRQRERGRETERMTSSEVDRKRRDDEDGK